MRQQVSVFEGEVADRVIALFSRELRNEILEIFSHSLLLVHLLNISNLSALFIIFGALRAGLYVEFARKPLVLAKVFALMVV